MPDPITPVAKVPGIDFNFGARVLTVPPLTLNAFKQLQRRGDITKVELNEESLDVCLTAIHAALVRNYPEMTLEDVGDLVDLSNLHDAMSCVLDVAGLKRKKLKAEADEAAQGNAPGAAGG